MIRRTIGTAGAAGRQGWLSRPIREIVVCLAVALGALLMPAIASAADTTINFDALPNGTKVTNQYSSEGVTFGQSPHGNADLGATILSDPSAAHSAPNVLDIEQQGICGAEANRNGLWGEFSAPRNHVNVYVGDVQSFASEHVILSGYDIDGNPIPTATETVTTSGDSRVDTPMSIVDPNNRISFFNVQGPPPAVCLAIDDLSFDAQPSHVSPDFGLSPQSGSVTVLAGQSADATLVLHRTSSSTGPISLSASGLPAGVSASFSPNPTTGGDGSQITMTLSAAANAPPVVNVPVTITGKPGSTTAGPVSHSTTIQVTVTGNFELRAQGIDVTQGIVNNTILEPSGDGSGSNYQGMQWAPVDSGNDPLPLTTGTGYDPLVQGNRTIVRVYADAPGAPAGGVPGVGAELSGYRNGVPLPGSPLQPEYGPASLPDTGEQGDPIVGPAERESDANAFTFTLPNSWTQGTISLTATMIPPLPTFNGPQYVPCSDPSCQAHTSFTLNNIPFVTLPWVVIATLSEGTLVDPSPPASPVPVYQRALLTEPAANQFAVLPYVGTVDPTTEVNTDNQTNSKPFTVTPNNPCPGKGYICNRNADLDYGKAVLDWGTQNLGTGQMLSAPALPADILSGVNEAQRGVTFNSIYNEPFSDPAQGSSAAQAATLVDTIRPLTSVAHETGHALGRNHSDDSKTNGQNDGSFSSGCGGGGGPWPPDGLGYMQGIGLDTSTYPYQILATGLPYEPLEWYDKMSYCANTNESTGGGNLPDTWTSPFGWLHSISALWLFGQRTGRGPNLPYPYSAYQGIEGAQDTAKASAVTPSYSVLATISAGGGAQIDSVIPTRTPTPAPANSTVELVARGSAGNPLATVPVHVSAVHDDPGPTFLVAQGAVPMKGTDSVQVVRGGTVLASRTRSARRPTIKILAPTAHALVGRGRQVTVRWRATAAKGDILEVVVDYSADNGRHWRGVYLGPNRGSVRLPSVYFSRSREARIRIIVNDGFNQVQGVSARFRALGTPPIVTIVDPSSGQSFTGEATIYLHGQAFDDALAPLVGRRLRWLVDGTTIGTGPTITPTALPPGADRVTLRATDPDGRTGSASITIHVKAVSLPFLRLSAPHRLAPRKRRLTLTAASALPTTVTVGRHRYALTRNARSITLTIAAGRQPLLIRLSVTARGVTYPLTLAVQR